MPGLTASRAAASAAARSPTRPPPARFVTPFDRAVDAPARPPARVGAVSYLNSRPLIEGLATHLGEPCVERCRLGGCRDRCGAGAMLSLELPSRLADGLAGDRLDAALVPSVFALTRPGFEVFSDACVTAAGPVRSVKAYFRVPPGDVRTLALDEGSRTSAALLRVLLSERYGVTPRIEPLPLAASASDVEADAVLVIGDRAMHDPPGPWTHVWDLGGEWFRWTGLPFVFAVWAGREDRDLQDIAVAVTAARDEGVRNLAAIAEREAPRLNLSPADAEGYLRTNLHFTLGPAERSGMALFAELLGRAGVSSSFDVPR